MNRKLKSALWQTPIAIGFFGLVFVSGFVWGNGGNVIDSIKQLPVQVSSTLAPEAPTASLKPIETFGQTFSLIKREAYDSSKIKEDQLTYLAIDGMLNSLGDPFTRFMDPKEFQQMQEDTRGNFVGIGAQLDSDPLGAIIKRPIPGSPAKEAGLKANDIITKVDGTDVAGKDIDEIVRLIRGDEGKAVTLTIKRKDEAELLTFRLVRRMIDTPNMEAYMEDDNAKIGRVWLGQFSEKAPEQLEEGIRQLEAQGMKALIIDLRFNPGGLLTSAIKVVSQLENQGPVVRIRDKSGEEMFERNIPQFYLKRDYPLVVLINGNSASASEIVSGAVKDYGVATLIGEKTFGKGLVQTVIPLQSDPDTAVAITTAKYYTPNGTDINRKRLPTGKFEGGGIVPDIEVKPSDDWTFVNEKGDTKDLQLQKALEVLREKVAKGEKRGSKQAKR